MEPKLRFKEFSGDWEEKKYSDLFITKSGYGFKANEYVSSGVPILKIDNVGYGNIKWDNISYLPLEYMEKYKELVLKEGDIVLALNRPITNGKLKIALLSKNDEPSILYQRVGKIVPKDVNYKFSYQLLSKKIFKFVQKTSVGSDQPFISTEKLKNLKLFIPSLPEQTKIADFLSIVDEKIQNQQDKITHLENIKKGFMQKIFSRKIRFKDANGNEFPEWEEKKLGEISKVTTGNSNVDDNIVNGKYRFFDRGLDSINYLNEYFLDAEAIIYPGEGSKFMPRYYNGKFALHQRCYAIYDMSHSINVKYVFYYMQTLNKYFLRTSVGTTVPSLRQSNFEKCKIEVPCLEEQQKIADLLSSFDEKIDAEKETLEHLKELKKGLLQQMFV